MPILLVDDKRADLMALEAVLASAEYELVRAQSGDEAYRQAELRDFAVVLLDVHMPRMDGLELAARIRSLPKRGAPVPIIFVTGIDDMPLHVFRAYAEGAADFVQKPLAPEVIRGKVSVFAELYRARRELVDEQDRVVRDFRTLTDLSSALSETATAEQVAATVVDRGARAAGADTCSLYLLDEAGTTLELIGHRGVAAEVVEQTRRIRQSVAASTFALLRAGTTTWVETAAEYERMHPSLSKLEARGRRARAFWSMPLIVEGRPVGLLGMGFYDERRFSMRDRSLVDAIGTQCGQALLRVRRLGAEERARALLTTTLRSIGDAVIATDADGRVTFMNAVAEQLTGWPEEDAHAQPLEEVFVIFSEETREPCQSPVAKVLREGKVVGLANHTVLRSRRGTEIPIDDSAAPIRDAGGQLFGVVLVFRDGSAEKREQMRRAFLVRAGAALASSLDYRATLATVAQLAVPQLADWCAVDLVEPGSHVTQQLAVAHVDPEKVAWARALGERYPPDPHSPTGAPQVIRSGKSELYRELPSEMLEAAAKDDEHRRIIRELRLESAMVVPVQGRDRTLGAITFIFADSGRRYTDDDLAFAEEFARRAAMAIENAVAFQQAEAARAEERLLRREADAANKSKDEFLATVSHELRTPLNAILGWAVTLRGRKLADDVDRALAVIERNAFRQARLVDDVLDMARIIGGKLTLSLGPTILADAIQGAIETVATAAVAKRVKIHTDVDASFTMTADGDRLHQIVWNLLANAVKFTPKDGNVFVRAYREGSYARIDVVDDGEGISAESLPHIFEPFRQADSSTTRKHGGLGLGLAIVRQLVSAHGGTVQARSNGPGRGAEFVVMLPARDAVPVVESRYTPTTPLSAGDAPRLDGLSVLVIDDEEDARDIIEHLLRDRGATVTTSASAREAVALVPDLRPEVIVSDIGMPDMDGYEFIRQVRALPVTRGGRTPAIALTAYARKEDAQRAFAAGFQMHLAKPVDPSQLATVVANVAGLSLDVHPPK